MDKIKSLVERLDNIIDDLHTATFLSPSGLMNGREVMMRNVVNLKRIRELLAPLAEPEGWKPRPLNPTPAMKTDGGRRLLSFQDGSTDASFSPLQWAAVKNEAERVWRSMWLCAGETVLGIDEHGKVSEAVPKGCVVPREPTQAMIRAIGEAHYATGGGAIDVGYIYKAMLSSAPPSPPGEKG